MWTAKKQNCNLLYLNKSFTHIEHRAGEVGRALNPSPHSGIFTSISVGSRPYSNYSLPLRSDLFPLRQSVAQNLFEVWRFTFEAGEAELRPVTEIAPKITVLMCEQKLYPVYLSRMRKSYPVQRKYNYYANQKRQALTRSSWVRWPYRLFCLLYFQSFYYNRYFPWRMEVFLSHFTLKARRTLRLKNNYRPISIIPVVGKVFERVVYDQFYMYLTFSPAKWRLGNERRNSILMTRHYSDLGTASDWMKQISPAVYDQSEPLLRSG